MDDDSDDGNWRGESQFIKNNKNKTIDNYKDYKDDENNYSEYNENYNPNYHKEIDDLYEDNYDDEDNQDYNSKENHYNDEDYYEDYNYSYYDETYNDDFHKYNYNDNDNYGYYKKNNNRNRNHNYNHQNNNNNEYNNRQFRNNNNRRYRNRPRFRPRNGGIVTSSKSKEYYFSSFRIKFKLWLMIVLKISEKSEIKFDEDQKINEEIYESFINLYNYRKDKIENKNNTNIEIENIEIKKIIQNVYNFEFNIIITEEIKVFFIKKYINIKVIGEVDISKYPKFYFQLKQYKLELNDESKKYQNKKKDNAIILDIKGKDDENKEKMFMIGMKPEYSIENKKFKKFFEKLQNDDSEESKNDEEKKKNNIKGPQEEIRNIFFELDEIINKEKKNGNSSK